MYAVYNQRNSNGSCSRCGGVCLLGGIRAVSCRQLLRRHNHCTCSIKVAGVGGAVCRILCSIKTFGVLGTSKVCIRPLLCLRLLSGVLSGGTPCIAFLLCLSASFLLGMCVVRKEPVAWVDSTMLWLSTPPLVHSLTLRSGTLY